MKNDDIKNTDKNNQELEQQLVQQHYGLVVSQALSFLQDHKNNIDDCIQAGLIGLLKAIRKYDKEKAKFSTFASVCIRNEILNWNRKENRKRKVKVLCNNTLLEKAENAFYNLKDKFYEIEPDFLTDEQQIILHLKLENYTNKEIAEHLSCSKGSLSNKIHNLIRVLKEANL